MKKFRFAKLHLIMIGLIIFGLLAILIRTLQSEVTLLLAIFAAISGLVGLLYYQQDAYEVSELTQIEQLNNQTEDNLKTLLEKMPVGIIQFEVETGEIQWYNPYAALIFTDSSGEFRTKDIQAFISRKKQGAADSSISANGKKYAVNLDTDAGMFYFYDSFREEEDRHVYPTSRPVIGIISIDNYDEVTDSLPDSEVSQINSFVANFISDFTGQRQIFYRRVSMDRFYFFTDYRVLKDLIDAKFDILDIFRKEAKDHDLPLTLSMGVAYGDGEHAAIGQIAFENLNIALVRGGDQVVLKENGEGKKVHYFGGGSASTVKRSRTRTRAMMTAISDRLKSADKVFVVGHRGLDMDALGAAVGMQFFASHIVDTAYLVYDPDDVNADISRALTALAEEGSSQLLTVSEALPMVTDRSILVMVDHSKPSLTLSRDLYSKFTDLIVVDHHRRDDDFPEHASLSFIESGASSASELVGELIEFQQARIRLSKLQASLLMAGIMLDTKNFSTRITSRTFNVASYLRTLGSDSVLIQTISATDFDEYRLVNKLILRGERFRDHTIIASGTDTAIYSNVIASKAADTMLAMAGIEATFVITKNQKGQVAISARSRSKVNVQRIMEDLGGGGHFNLAACQFEDMTVSQATELLKATLEEQLKIEEE